MPALSQFAQADPRRSATRWTVGHLRPGRPGEWHLVIAHVAHGPDIGTAMWTGLSQWLYSLLRGMFLGIWNATLLPIPHSVTDQFAPVQAIFAASGPIAAAGVVLAVVLLGVRTLVRGITGQGGVLDELMGRLMVYSCALSLLPWIISHGIDLEQAIVRSVAVDSLDAVLPQTTVANPIALVLLIVFGLRLWLKVASNVVYVAVAIAWSPVALACGLIPEGAWVASLWVREFVGRLTGAVLATDTLLGEWIEWWAAASPADRAKASPVLCLVDEAARTPIPAIPEYMATMAGYGISVWVAVQSLAQLETSYGPARATTIRDAADAHVYYRQRDVHTAEALSRRTGPMLVHGRHNGTSQGNASSRSDGYTEREQPLLLPHEVLQLDAEHVVVFAGGPPPARLGRIDWRKDRLFSELVDQPAPTVPVIPAAPLPDWQIPTATAASARTRTMSLDD